MGNDNKTVRSKINNLTVLCENLWPISYYPGGLLLALSSGSSRMYRKSTDKLLCEVGSFSLFYGLKLQLILLLTVFLSLPINDLPYFRVCPSKWCRFCVKNPLKYQLVKIKSMLRKCIDLIEIYHCIAQTTASVSSYVYAD